MNRQEKAELISQLTSSLNAAQAILVAAFKGVSVPKVVELRKTLRESGVKYRVTKNTLAKIAIAGTDKEFLGEHLQGPTALAWSDSDPVAVAKILSDFAKDNEGLSIKGGYLSGRPLSVAGVDALAKLPGRDELRSSFLSVLQAPASKFVTLCSQAQRDILSVLKQREEQLDT